MSDTPPSDTSRPLRIGAVSYLNTKPLIHSLKLPHPQWQLELDLPSRLADRLDDGSLDVALVPSIAFWQRPTYHIVSNACIGCRGPVLSVKLVARCPMDQVRTLALDEGSRTSVALAQILLDQRLGVQPQLEPFPMGCSIEDTTADAVLIIGDRAMHIDASSYEEVWDLGEAWVEWTGLPFVFAMWVARADVAPFPLEDILNSARDAGVAQLESIAQREAEQLGWPVERCVSYLQDHLHFTMGPAEWKGLKLFYREAVARGFAPAGWDPDESRVLSP